MKNAQHVLLSSHWEWKATVRWLQLCQVQGQDPVVHCPGTEEGHVTQSWHMTEGSLEEVLLKQKSRNTGNGGRGQKAWTKIKEESGVCRELSVSAQRRKVREVVRERAGRREVKGVPGEYSCSPGEHFGPHYMKLSLQMIQKNHWQIKTGVLTT